MNCYLSICIGTLLFIIGDFIYSDEIIWDKSKKSFCLALFRLVLRFISYMFIVYGIDKFF